MYRLALTICLSLICPATIWADDSATAKEILSASGVRAGLCLHLGCGRAESPGLTAALAENGLAVHGLAIDDAALARTREKIEAKGLLGRATAEKLALNPLPYVSDLANLAVVEDLPALAAQGLTKDEILRVVAPGGAMLIKEGGAWAKAVKPRPKEMDEWTHIRHGADCNPFSEDKLAKLPAGLKWIDGLPMCINGWASTRGWVLAGGRCYSYSSNELANLGPVRGKDNYLVARDAFNGLPLWKINCGPADPGAGLNFRNTAALVADASRVYAVQRGKLIAVDGATGQIVQTISTKFPAARLLLLDGMLVASCWDGKDNSHDDFDGGSLWPTWLPKSDNGSIEAYESATGKPAWSASFPAYLLMASDGVVYAMTNKGNPPTERYVVAMELATGKEKWRVPHTDFGPLAGLQLNMCGPGYVVVSQRGKGNGTPMGTLKKGEVATDRAVFVLSADNGKVLWKLQAADNVFVASVNGLLWTGKSQYEPKTGQVKGALPGMRSESEMCTSSYLVNNYQLRTRGGTFRQVDLSVNPPVFRSVGFHTARGACIEGMVPAYGMFFTAQNNCHCEPGHVYGFLGIAPGTLPGKADFPKPRPVEKGPAFGALEADSANPADWPTYRHDAQRTAATTAAVPEQLKEAWKVQVAAPAEGPLAEAWKARLASPLTAPVASGGMIFVAAADAGQVVALDEATGKKAWATTLGGRIDTPPTIYRGLCVVGSHDGWVYALRAKDGQLAWRTRVAPWERRMVAYGQVESVWPTIGTVVTHDGLLFANAGRSMEADGGIAIVALDPATGGTTWAKAMSSNGYGSINDMLYVANGQLAMVHTRTDPKTGGNLKAGQGTAQGGMLDGTWTMVGRHRSGNAYRIERAGGDLMAWNDKIIVTPNYAITPEKAQKPKVVESAPAAEAKKDAASKPAVKPGALVPEDFLWQQDPKACQVEAMAMAANAVVYAGRVVDAKKASQTYFLRVVALADGKKLSEIALDSPPTYDGLAVVNNKVLLSLQDGTLLCLGK